jgi:peptide/nickel transport system permease protein
MADAAIRAGAGARRRAKLHPKLAIGLTGVLGMLVLTVLLPWLLSWNPNAGDPLHVLQPPSWEHWMGTDAFGRDVLVRTVFGARLSLAIGAFVCLASFVLGMALGMLAAYLRWTDGLIMRATDALLSLPPVLLAIAFVAVFGAGLTNVLVALTLVWTPLTIRMARASTLAILAEGYVEPAEALGAHTPGVLWRHVLRNAVDPVLVQQTVAFAGAILGEATFSFIGAGIQVPRASLGSILGEAQYNLFAAPWLATGPAIVLVVLVLSIVLTGDGLRDLLEKRR